MKYFSNVAQWTIATHDTTECSDLVSEYLGYLSITFWLFAQFPQIWYNHQKRDAKPLSILFLLIWLVGDVCNLIGAYLTFQLPFQVLVLTLDILGLLFCCR
jgi:hypothetical protein